MNMAHTPASTALARFKVLDLSRVRAGPTCARQLADWGADVITVELPPSIDTSDPHVGPRDGADFMNLNRNKRSITVNLKHPDGQAIVKRLAGEVDVVIENFRPQVKHRLGLDYDSLAGLNSRLVYASISGFGQDGPYRDRPGFDQIAQAMGGLMSITGRPGDGPMRVGVPIADLCAGLFAAYGILVALLEREVSGRGQWVQTSLLQAQIFMLDFQAARWLIGGEVPQQDGNYHATIAPCGSFATADGHVSLAVVGELMWQRFCTVLGREAWLNDRDYAGNAARVAHRESLHQAIEQDLGAHARDSWIARFNQANVPCGPIYAVDELFDDPQVRHLGAAQPLAGPGGATVAYLGQPLNLERTPSHIVQHAPALGEHTDTVLADLGYAATEIAEWRARGVI